MRTRRTVLRAGVAVVSAGLVNGSRAFAAPVTPLPQAHAHNDYEHPRPLLDALDQGFCSVEADIYLVEGQLLVAHNRQDVKPERTLEKLYLEPLRERVKANRGKVYPGGPVFSLMIDLKTGAEATYPVLAEKLRPYREILTGYEGVKVTRRAVDVVLSGSISEGLAGRKLVSGPEERLAAVDGRPPDLGGDTPASLVPWVSASWLSLFKWTGEGEFPADQRERLRDLVKRAHAQGRKVRFWATPERREVWQELAEAGVDLLNTDRLSDLRSFLLMRQAIGK